MMDGTPALGVRLRSCPPLNGPMEIEGSELRVARGLVIDDWNQKRLLRVRFEKEQAVSGREAVRRGGR